jgi:hypothetical protein
MGEANWNVADDALLELGRHVDEDVPAAHEIELRERGIGSHVVAHECDTIANGLRDPEPSAFCLREEALEPVRPDDARGDSE